MSSEINDIKCIVYDFDGVMTDNRVTVDQYGNESVTCNRGDGYGISQIKKLGIEQVIISTEVNPVVEMRAKKLRIPVIHGVEDKGEVLRKYCEEKGYSLSSVLYMGNDLNDMPAMELAGYKAAPADAEQEILDIADWISERNGGYGAVRDLYRYISENID